MSEYPLPNFEEEFNRNTSFGQTRIPPLPTQVQIEQEAIEPSEQVARKSTTNFSFFQNPLPPTTEEPETPQPNLDQIEEDIDWIKCTALLRTTRKYVY